MCLLVTSIVLHVELEKGVRLLGLCMYLYAMCAVHVVGACWYYFLSIFKYVTCVFA